MGEAVLVASLEGVVVTVAVAGEQAYAGDPLVRPPRLDITRTRVGAVEVELAGIQERALGSNVADFQCIVAAELPRHLQVPVLKIGIEVSAARLD